MDNECNHCWHNSGYVFMTDPPKIRQVCCWCGLHQNKYYPYLETPVKHGNFLPGRELTFEIREDDHGQPGKVISNG